jgi:hypothetical protein
MAATSDVIVVQSGFMSQVTTMMANAVIMASYPFFCHQCRAEIVPRPMPALATEKVPGPQWLDGLRRLSNSFDGKHFDEDVRVFDSGRFPGVKEQLVARCMTSEFRKSRI